MQRTLRLAVLGLSVSGSLGFAGDNAAATSVTIYERGPVVLAPAVIQPVSLTAKKTSAPVEAAPVIVPPPRKGAIVAPAANDIALPTADNLQAPASNDVAPETEIILDSSAPVVTAPIPPGAIVVDQPGMIVEDPGMAMGGEVIGSGPSLITFRGALPPGPTRMFPVAHPCTGVRFEVPVPCCPPEDIDYERRQIELEYQRGEIEIEFKRDGRVTVEYDFHPKRKNCLH